MCLRSPNQRPRGHDERDALGRKCQPPRGSGRHDDLDRPRRRGWCGSAHRTNAHVDATNGTDLGRKYQPSTRMRRHDDFGAHVGAADVPALTKPTPTWTRRTGRSGTQMPTSARMRPARRLPRPRGRAQQADPAILAPWKGQRQRLAPDPLRNSSLSSKTEKDLRRVAPSRASGL